MPKQVSSKRKRIVLTLKQKMEICKRLENGESRAVLMEEFNVGSSTIYSIKAQSQKIKEFYVKSESDKSVEKRHTLHTPKMEELDQALYEWFLLKKSQGGCISGPMLQEKARELHEKMKIEGQCSFSSGWLTRFKVRHGICKLDLSGEQKSADYEAATSFRDVVTGLVTENGFIPEPIYNAKETGFPVNSAAASSRVYDEICELVDSANDKMNLSRDELNRWLAVDKAIPVTHTLNTEDIIEAVVNRGKMNVVEEEESDDDGREVEKVSWQRAIAAFETVIAFAEQQPFFTSQHIMQLLIMQNLTLRERRRASKQADVRSVFKKAAHKFASTASSTDVEPKPSTSTSAPVLATSSHPDDPDAMSTQ